MKTATNARKPRPAKTAFVARSSRRGAYDITCESILVDHPELGRILISEGFGGNAVDGQSYRFRHGMALRVNADATFAALEKEEAENMGPLSDVYEILDWDGAVIDAVARSHSAA